MCFCVFSELGRFPATLSGRLGKDYHCGKKIISPNLCKTCGKINLKSRLHQVICAVSTNSLERARPGPLPRDPDRSVSVRRGPRPRGGRNGRRFGGCCGGWNMDADTVRDRLRRAAEKASVTCCNAFGAYCNLRYENDAVFVQSCNS